jgi:hypothetical protein
VVKFMFLKIGSGKQARGRPSFSGSRVRLIKGVE